MGRPPCIYEYVSGLIKRFVLTARYGSILVSKEFNQLFFRQTARPCFVAQASTSLTELL